MNADKSMPSSIVDAQVQRLLEIVNDYQEQQCDKILEHARSQSRKIVRQAYRNARLRLHHDIQESRLSMEQELSAARAKQHTFLMQQRHREDQEFLNQAWQVLAEKLVQRWSNQKQRQIWIQNIITIALKALPAKNWQVDHPVDWSRAEQKEFAKTVNDVSSHEVNFNGVEDISAGVRINADSALVDGTVQGLMVDRSRIESEILAQRQDYLVRHEKQSG